MKLIGERKCDYCRKFTPVYYGYAKKRFCNAKCRSMKLPMPPRPDVTGHIPWNKGLSAFDSPKIMEVARNRVGVNNPNWLHGKSKAHRSMWGTSVHKVWRKAVFERDDYSCVLCGVRGTELQADHIKCFAHNPDIRYDINNGRTLCLDCHKQTKNYGVHRKESC